MVKNRQTWGIMNSQGDIRLFEVAQKIEKKCVGNRSACGMWPLNNIKCGQVAAVNEARL